MKKILLLEKSSEMMRAWQLRFRKVVDIELVVVQEANALPEQNKSDVLLLRSQFVTKTDPEIFKFVKDNLSKTILFVDEQDDCVRWQELGIAHFLRHPFSTESILQEIDKVMKKKSSSRPEVDFAYISQKDMDKIRKELLPNLKANIRQWVDKEIAVMAKSILREEIKRILETPQ